MIISAPFPVVSHNNFKLNSIHELISTWSKCQGQGWAQKACRWQLLCQCLWPTERQCVFDCPVWIPPACPGSEACPWGEQPPLAPACSLVALLPHWARLAKRNLYGSKEKTDPNWTWWAGVLRCDVCLWKQGCSSSYFHDWNVMHWNLSLVGALSYNCTAHNLRLKPGVDLLR